MKLTLACAVLVAVAVAGLYGADPVPSNEALRYEVCDVNAADGSGATVVVTWPVVVAVRPSLSVTVRVTVKVPALA